MKIVFCFPACLVWFSFFSAYPQHIPADIPASSSWKISIHEHFWQQYPGDPYTEWDQFQQNDLSFHPPVWIHNQQWRKLRYSGTSTKEIYVRFDPLTGIGYGMTDTTISPVIVYNMNNEVGEYLNLDYPLPLCAEEHFSAFSFDTLPNTHLRLYSVVKTDQVYFGGKSRKRIFATDYIHDTLQLVEGIGITGSQYSGSSNQYGGILLKLSPYQYCERGHAIYFDNAVPADWSLHGGGQLSTDCKEFNWNTEYDGQINRNVFSGEGIQIFPNPGMDHFSISLPPGETFDLILYDVQGRKIDEMTGLKNGVRIPAGNYLPGLYYLRLTGGDASGKTLKWTKMN